MGAFGISDWDNLYQQTGTSSESETESFLPSDSSGTTDLPCAKSAEEASSSFSVDSWDEGDCSRSLVRNATACGNIASKEDRATKRKDLLRKRLQELQDRAEMCENKMTLGAGPQNWRWEERGYDRHPSSMISPMLCCNGNSSDEQFYWPSQEGYPRIPFVWEEKPGRAKQFEADRWFSDCNEEFGDVSNFSEDETSSSTDFLSAADEFVDLKKSLLSPLTLPPRLVQRQHYKGNNHLSDDQSPEKFFSGMEDDPINSPHLRRGDDAMALRSTRKHSLIELANHMPPQKGGCIDVDIKKQVPSNQQNISKSKRRNGRVFSLPHDFLTGWRGDEANCSHQTMDCEGKNGLEVLLASLSPHSNEQLHPGRMLILKDQILHAPIVEKGRNFLLSHGRTDLRACQSCNYRSDYERAHRNKGILNGKAITKKLYTSFGCGRASDVILNHIATGANKPMIRRRSQYGS